MCFGFVVFDFSVSSILCRVLDDVEISNVYCVLQGVWGVVVEEIFIEEE